jgi:uncharacterized glyoxalase superfamily protein PhnB
MKAQAHRAPVSNRPRTGVAVALVTVLRKLTPVLVVERIEPVIPFWRKLGVTATTEVPDGAANDGRLAFAILAAEGIEVMYQTTASFKEDLLKSASVKEAFRGGTQQASLYVEVSQLSEVESKLQDERLIMPRRTTFYGSTEVGYADPAGNIVVFSEHYAAPT